MSLTAFEDEDIPADIWATAEAMALESGKHPFMWSLAESVARAIYIERAQWKPAVTYFERYCQDEADEDGDLFTGCSQQQHEDAKAFAAAIRRGTP